MSILSTKRRPPQRITRQIEADQKIYFVSDLHLGDGGRSDVFGQKDDLLLAFLAHVSEEGAHLVIGGDAVDFHQAWSLTRVLRAHGAVLSALTDHAIKHGVTYIWGNHDEDISLFRDLLRMEVCSSLQIGDKVLVQHGYEYDPMIGPHMEGSHTATLLHHFVERLLGTWIRLPLENFYTRTNRAIFWCAHKTALLCLITLKLGRGAILGNTARHLLEVAHYWIRSQCGDPGGLYQAVRTQLHESPWPYLVTGHSHLPGQVRIDANHTYVNTGSWTFGSSTYAVWNGESFQVQCWKTGRTYTDRAYRHLNSGLPAQVTFFDWWRKNYMGWFRYRPGEERRMLEKQALAGTQLAE